MIRALQVVAAGLLGLDVALVSMQVILRFLFDNPQAWAEEVGRYVFVWVIFLGAIVALARGTHIRVTVVTDHMVRRGEAISRWLNWLLGIPTFGFVAWMGFQLAWRNRATEFYTIDGAPRVIYYLAVPVCFAAMTAVLLVLRRRMLTPTPYKDAGDA